MTLSEELSWRGFLQQTTLKDLTVLDQEKVIFYHGYDATANSQTVGNLAALMLDRLLLKHGHEAILLAGGATSLIGDPGGKESERNLTDEKEIKSYVGRAQEQIKNILRGYKYKSVNNIDWNKDLKLIPFLRDIGKHYSMTPLVQRDYIAQRIGQQGSGISFAEFSYTLIQGNDYLYLYDKYKCTLQLGGSDQWGNCLSGVELVRKKRGQEVHALTMPLLINKATGKKFGKTENEPIWLDSTKTSVFRFYQFWLNVDDESVATYLKIFTELNKSQIDLTLAEFETNRALRMAQRVLAYEVTKIVHGKKRADEVSKTTKVLYGEGSFQELGKNEMHILRQELPVVKVKDDLPQVIVDSGLAKSKKEARNFLTSGSISVNGQKAGPENLDLFVKGNNLLKRGKNTFAIVEK